MIEGTPVFTMIVNSPMNYAWGEIDGVAKVLGLAPSGVPEAELWLGAHPSSPSRIASATPWRDLRDWELSSGRRLPYLLKILSAALPLSIQAHPTTEQARAGFDREERLGIPRDAPQRNYKDRNAKPELILALDDGFEALCGFRHLGDVIADIDELLTIGVSPFLLAPWRDRLAAAQDARSAFEWLISGEPVVSALVCAVADTSALSGRFELLSRLSLAYPGDPGVLVALVMNHVLLGAGEAIWMPAGVVHAYLRGNGVELMGPSDNVLRGGLTPKHVDRAELARVLDFSTGETSRLDPIPIGANARIYRPKAVVAGAAESFELIAVDGDAVLEPTAPAIAVITDGQFCLNAAGHHAEVSRGTALFISETTRVLATGAGRMFVATTSRTLGRRRARTRKVSHHAQ